MSNETPDCWPPEGQATADGPTESPGEVVPLFPLSDVWLFPGMALPLFIFEPRYRQMVEDSLDRAGRIVIGTVRKGHEGEMPGNPPIYPVAGLGEIGRHERRADGCFVILLVGMTRVHHEEVPSDRLYRRVRVQPVCEHPVPEDKEAEYRERLTNAIAERTDDAHDLPDGLPLSNLTDLLMLRTPLPHGVLCRLFGELDLERRIDACLIEHARRPIKE